jgi:Zn-dependent M28 family amino/carboxypeptidase
MLANDLLYWTRVMEIYVIASRFILVLALLGSGSFLTGQEPAKSVPEIANTPQGSTGDRLRKTLEHLCDTIGERNTSKPKKLTETVEYLQKSFETMGYKIERQTFEVSEIDCHNLIAEVLGKDKPAEIVLVGAHYDSARGTPGANDNGSGVAALLEIARQLQGKQFSRTIRFVSFANEEQPYFQRDGQMGSWVYAKACRANSDNLKVVLSLETMGYFTDEPNSQKYPPLLAAMYPSTGNFIGIVSDIKSRPLLTEVAKRLKKNCAVDVQSASLPSELQGVGWSDHWSFWQEGYAGVMVTDTAFFRYPHYHERTDTVDKIEFVRYAQVVDGLAKSIAEFADDRK